VTIFHSLAKKCLKIIKNKLNQDEKNVTRGWGSITPKYKRGVAKPSHRLWAGDEPTFRLWRSQI
jgi:hypothetical protein